MNRGSIFNGKPSLFGRLLLLDGSSSVPSLSFASELTLGFYRAGAASISTTATTFRLGANGTLAIAGSGVISADSNGTLTFRTGTNQTALILNTSLNAMFGASVYAASFGTIGWDTRAAMSSPSDGIIRLTNGAGTDFTRLQLGGTTASFPALRRQGTGLDLVLADNSGWSEMSAGNFKQGSTLITWTSGAGSPEGVVTAPVGSLYSRSNGGASTSLYVKESGAGNTGWIAK